MNRRKLTKWFAEFKVFILLLTVMLFMISFTAWKNRPNTMKTPRYIVNKSYMDEEGSYDFIKEQEELMFSLGTSVDDVLFRLDQGYCLQSNDVELCVEGYELLQTQDKYRVANYRDKFSTNKFLLTKVTIRNQRETDIIAKYWGRGENNLMHSIRPLDSEDIQINNNLAENTITNSSGQAIKSGKEISGVYVYALNDITFNQLYFEGNFTMVAPEIVDKNQLDSHNLFAKYSKIEMPVVPNVLDKYLKTVQNLPVSLVSQGNGYTEVIQKTDVNQHLEDDRGNIELDLHRIENGIATYKPSYFDGKKRNRNDNETEYTAVEVTILNKTNQTIDSTSLQLSIQSRDSEFRGYAHVVGRYRIQPGEAVNMVFVYDIYQGEFMYHEKNKDLKLKVNTINDTNLLEVNFKIEE